MKRLILPLLALSMLVACGKDNKSGKSEWSYSDPYYGNYNSGMQVPTYNNRSLHDVINNVGCFPGASYPNSSTGRHIIQEPLVGFPSIVGARDVYVGITSYGDVAAIVGNGSGAPTFIAYLCPRNFTNYQGSTISNVRLGSYTSRCHFKPLISATLM